MPARYNPERSQEQDLEGKLKHEPTGRVTRKELEYGRHDVERTVALLNAAKLEYDGFSLKDLVYDPRKLLPSGKST